MNYKHFSVVGAICISLCMLAGCGNEIKKNTDIDLPSTEESSVLQESDNSEQDSEPVSAEVTFEEAVITAKTAKYTEFTKTYDAESGTVSGKAKIGDSREGFEGKGYVTEIAESDDWSLSFELPENQYYNISVTLASDKAVKNGFAVNGTKISEFTTNGSGEFEIVSFNNILLEKGVSKISLVPEDGQLDIDSVTVTASKDIEDLDFTLKKPSLSNKNADYLTKAIYSFLCENYGKAVILGQHDTVGTLGETQLMYKTTGKYPAIRFGDMMYCTDESNAEIAEAEIQSAISWAKDGGLVGYMWHWSAPDEKGGYYSEDTDFDLSSAVTAEKIAKMDISDIEKLYKDEKITKECVQLIKDIDTVSEQLKRFEEEGITVIWRPLHEASNGYFWWGNDEKSYKWLWKVIYTRQTQYHKLNNLIWVWSAQNVNWYVGNDYCDILSVDIYSDNNDKSGQVNSLLYLKSISAGKPVAISECGCLPLIQSIADQKAMWSYIGQWSGEFIMDNEGKLSETYNSKADIITMYNNNLTVTRDKLPDFISLASSIKEQEEKEEQAEKEEESDTAQEEITEITEE